jgi:hypothetical protein
MVSKFHKSFRKKHPDLHALIALFAIVMIWRTVWGLMDNYFLPQWPFASYVIGGIVGLIVLLYDDFHLSELQ